MKILDFLYVEDIELDLPASNKRAVLEMMSDRLSQRAGVSREKVLQALAAREQLGPTGINHGIAIPHARLETINTPTAAFMRLDHPIDFEAADGNPVDLVVAVIWPARTTDAFLATLAELCRLLREPRLLQGLRDAGTPQDVRALLCQVAEQAPSADKRLDVTR